MAIESGVCTGAAKGCQGWLTKAIRLEAVIVMGAANPVRHSERQAQYGRFDTQAQMSSPRVSIGLPVYNGAAYLAAAVESIRAQTFGDFELLIADNASTDDTETIGRRYADQDPRIRYRRQPCNLGAVENHRWVYERSAGQYFKWAAHDDVLHPEFLARCVAALDADPELAYCFTRTVVIDAAGRELGRFRVSVPDVHSPHPHQRYRGLLRTDRWCVELFGLFRRAALEQTRLMESYVASDRVLRAELGLVGRGREIPEYLFYSRDHDQRSTRAMPAHHLRTAWYDPRLAGRWVLPHWRLWMEYGRSIRRARLTASEKWKCAGAWLGWVGQDANGARLLADLLIAAWPGSWKLLYRLSGSGTAWMAGAVDPVAPARPAIAGAGRSGS
jgi:glycosyltransferase involved in cell wall biosynthesis